MPRQLISKLPHPAHYRSRPSLVLEGLAQIVDGLLQTLSLGYLAGNLHLSLLSRPLNPTKRKGATT